jgi:glycosyltransferase involved in cell wall biosynthesis
MSAGLPVIAPESGCYLEIIKNGYNGRLCRLEYLYEDILEAINMYSKKRSLIHEMGANSREYVVEKLPRSKVVSNFCRFLDGDLEEIDNDISINAKH